MIGRSFGLVNLVSHRFQAIQNVRPGAAVIGAPGQISQAPVHFDAFRHLIPVLGDVAVAIDFGLNEGREFGEKFSFLLAPGQGIGNADIFYGWPQQRVGGGILDFFPFVKNGRANSLQTLDYKLRTTCVAKTNLLDIATAWKNIKRARSKLTPPFSNELDAANADLVAMEREIDETIERNEETRTVDLVKEYFRSMSRVFLTVDRGLKEFCMRLSDVNQPLQIVLSMC